MDNEENKLDGVITVDEFIELRPKFLTKERFYFLLRNKKNNGLNESGSLVKIGRVYHLNYKEFSDWLYRYININGRG